MSAKKRIRRSRSQWEELLEQQAASGLSASEFCRREGMSLASFARWRTRCGEPSCGPTPFVEWRVPQVGSAGLQPGEMELVLPGGVRLRLRA
jgi:putative transposase